MLFAFRPAGQLFVELSELILPGARFPELEDPGA
jgi:hypothetical protein